ncbi:MAG: FG-GAP repeat protein [Verrucomicrobia bacterium]|nr:FG-GAP repeat protein [Verrucomicrobiota bacterium]
MKTTALTRLFKRQNTGKNPPCLNGRAWIFAVYAIVASCAQICLKANTADFNSDGKADFLYYNEATRVCSVWFMNGTSKIGSATITYAGSPLAAGQGWKICGTGFFDSNNNQRLGILWQDQVNQLLGVWYLNGTTVDGFAMINTVPAAGWKAAAVGDFDGDGFSDVAFQNETTGQGAVWLMTGTTFKTAGVINNQFNWRITGAGDFGNPATPTAGGTDGKSDILLTSYDPANDEQAKKNNFAGIWFMNGINLALPKVVAFSSGANVLVDNPDFRAVATGNFNLDANSNTDIGFRFVTMGRQAAWYQSGYVSVGGSYLTPEPDPAMHLYSQDWFQSTWRYQDVFPSISATPSGSTITLNFRIKPYQSFKVTIRRRANGGSWQTLQTGWPDASTPSYTDSDPNLQSGVRYEYEVTREGNPPMPQGFQMYFPARVISGFNLPDPSVSGRGKVLVIVDGTVAPNITSSLNTYVSDLAADGWTVVTKTDAPRHDDSWETCANGLFETTALADANNAANKASVKQWIRDNSTGANGIVLIGHVTVPFSGDDANFDGHGDHGGSWVADLWYGDMGPDSNWTDASNMAANCKRFPWNRNAAGDGRFDQEFAPAGLSLFVGRIDFSRLPAFGTGDSPSTAEYNLLTQYFAKNHAYRAGSTQYPQRGVVFGTFGAFDNDPAWPNHTADMKVYENAMRNLTAIYGSGFETIITGDPFHQKSNSYQWGFLAGSGQPTIISEGQPGGSEGTYMEHHSSDFINSEPKVAFYALLGSYFGDWLLGDDFMRAALATPSYGLAVVWVAQNPEPGTHWQFQSLGVGDTLGNAMVQTINDGLSSLGADRATVLSIIGDPTLTVQ